MTQSNYSPGFEAQVRKAMEMPEPDYQKMNMMREQFVRKGSAALKTRNHLTETGRKSTFLTRRPAWQWMMVGLVILITAVLATPGTVKAIRSLLGFIPGIGYVVNTPSALVLAEPIVIEREGFTLTILQAISTNEKTEIVYHYTEPESTEANRSPHTLGPVDPIQFPVLKLSDGSVLKLLDAQPLAYGDDNGLSTPLWFPPLPSGTESVILEFTRLNGMPDGMGPEGWVIPMVFKAADLSQIALPIVEYTALPKQPQGTKEVEQNAEGTEASRAITHTVQIDSFTLSLEKSVELEDGYVLSGNLQWTDTSISPFSLMLVDAVIKDANGQIVNYEWAPPAVVEQPDAPRKDWSYKIPSKDFAAPLGLEFHVVRWDREEASFQFNPGANLQDGQTLDLNIDVPINEHILKVISAKFLNPYNNKGAFELTIASEDIIGAIVIDQNQSMMAGGGESNALPAETGLFSTAFEVASDLSAGPVNVSIQTLEHLVPGDWTISWAP